MKEKLKYKEREKFHQLEIKLEIQSNRLFRLSVITCEKGVENILDVLSFCKWSNHPFAWPYRSGRTSPPDWYEERSSWKNWNSVLASLEPQNKVPIKLMIKPYALWYRKEAAAVDWFQCSHSKYRDMINTCTINTDCVWAIGIGIWMSLILPGPVCLYIEWL